MKTATAVAAGGALGAAARYALALALGPAEAAAFPLATFAANMSGSLLLGILLGAAAVRTLPEAWKEGLGTGLLGGYTTFSAFGVETLLLLQHGSRGIAAVYVLLSLLLGYAAAQAGYEAGRRAAARREADA